MIQKKKKKCKGCGNECYIWAKGRCQLCHKPKPEGLKTKGGVVSTKPKKVIRKFNPKTKKKRSEKRTCLSVYFEYHIQRCNASEEAGKGIPEPNGANIAHLFSKRSHPSVMCNINNCVYLTLQEHTRFDYLLDTFQFSKLEEEFKNSWPIVCKRFKKLIPLCEEKTKFLYKLKEYLSL